MMRVKLICLSLLLVASVQVVLLHYYILTQSVSIGYQWRRVSVPIPVLVPSAQAVGPKVNATESTATLTVGENTTTLTVGENNAVSEISETMTTLTVGENNAVSEISETMTTLTVRENNAVSEISERDPDLTRRAPELRTRTYSADAVHARVSSDAGQYLYKKFATDTEVVINNLVHVVAPEARASLKEIEVPSNTAVVGAGLHTNVSPSDSSIVHTVNTRQVIAIPKVRANAAIAAHRSVEIREVQADHTTRHLVTQRITGNPINTLANSIAPGRLSAAYTHTTAASSNTHTANADGNTHTATADGNDHPATNTPEDRRGGCREPYCLEYLDQEERAVYKACERKVTWQRVHTCACRFINGTGRPRVALVSLPGSGNTWVRGLLQSATGVCTGSIACDKTLRAEGFCGEAIHSSGQLVIKTHDSILQWTGGRKSKANRPSFDAAVFLIRDPFKAAVAEWNRELSNRFSTGLTGSNHVKYVDNPGLFGSNQRWDQFCRKHINRWKVMMNSYVIKGTARPILPVWYEDLRIDAVQEVKKILRFLKFPTESVNMALHQDFSTFYRNHTSSFDPFTDSQKQYYNTIIHAIAQATGRRSIQMQQHITDYARYNLFVHQPRPRP